MIDQNQNLTYEFTFEHKHPLPNIVSTKSGITLKSIL